MNPQAQRALLAQLGIRTAEAPQDVEPEAEGPPDFDGGAREPAPVPTDPNVSHNELIVELARRNNGGEW